MRRRSVDINVQMCPSAKDDVREKTKALIARGDVVLPGACVCCGSTEKLYVHHRSYDDPRDVEQRCMRCHMKGHYVELSKETAYTLEEIQDYILHCIVDKASLDRITKRVGPHCVGTQLVDALSKLVDASVVVLSGGYYRTKYNNLREAREDGLDC